MPDSTPINKSDDTDQCSFGDIGSFSLKKYNYSTSHLFMLKYGVHTNYSTLLNPYMKNHPWGENLSAAVQWKTPQHHASPNGPV